MCYNGVGSAPLSLPQIPQLPVRRHTFIVADRRQVCYLLFWLCKKIYNCRLTERAPVPWVLESIFLGLVGLAQTSDEETKQYSYQECGDHYSSTYFRCANFLDLGDTLAVCFLGDGDHCHHIVAMLQFRSEKISVLLGQLRICMMHDVVALGTAPDLVVHGLFCGIVAVAVLADHTQCFLDVTLTGPPVVLGECDAILLLALCIQRCI